jgi:hypothetical protein
MKKINTLISLIILIFVISCEKGDDLNLEVASGFKLELNDSIVFSSNQIDFYDFSSHLIYLKDGNSFTYSNDGFFKVLVDSSVIYRGSVSTFYSSYFSMGSVIYCAPNFYNNCIIPIGFNQYVDSNGDSNVDPRNDARIIDALKKNNQYRAGLSCKILSVQKTDSKTVKVDLQLTNNDSDDLLYLDPYKMGLGLFHYFTNGLIISDLFHNSYTHRLSINRPNPWNLWRIEWLSTIKSKETKSILIVYDDFDAIPIGQFEVMFTFPGLSYQIDKSNLRQDNGRIWLGEIQLKKTIEL